METEQDPDQDSPSQLRPVPIDWEALEDAFENNAPEVHSYLHLSTGEVLRVVDGIADPQVHARIVSDGHYARIEPVSSREQYRWMERYIQMLDAGPLQDLLKQAIDGKGAFRRFKDMLMSHGAERERWFAFRSERLRAFMESWLTAHVLTPVERPELPPATVEQVTSADEPIDGATRPPPVARAQQAKDALRRQLREVADALGGRDLEKVVAFAEFVRARRANSRQANAADGRRASNALEQRLELSHTENEQAASGYSGRETTPKVPA